MTGGWRRGRRSCWSWPGQESEMLSPRKMSSYSSQPVPVAVFEYEQKEAPGTDRQGRVRFPPVPLTAPPGWIAHQPRCKLPANLLARGSLSIIECHPVSTECGGSTQPCEG